MSKKENKTPVPKLRFPEFQDSEGWGLKELGECLAYLQPTKYLVSSTAYNNKYTTPVLTAGKTFILGYTNESEGIYNQNLPVIIFDDFTTATKYVDFPFKAKSSAMKILLAKKDASIKFCYESMQMLNYEVGVHERHWISIFSKLSIPIPDPMEQKKIADCLSSVDELINTQAQKVDVLKAHKKGLMQQLFPAEGETIPKLRFPEFRDAGKWSPEKFGEICKFVRGPFGGTLKKDIFVKEGYAVYEQSHAIYGNFDDFRYYITKEKYAELKRFAVRPNDLIMSCSGTMGKFAVVPSQHKEGVINQALLKLTVKKGYNLRFIKSTLEHPINQEKLLSQSAGGAIKNVVGVGQLKEIELPMPGLQEQQEITDFLTSIEELITTQTQKIDALKAHKKGLMQQLFPAIDEVGA